MTYTDDDLTPWFPPDVKPVHEGVYQIEDYPLNDEYEQILCYACWRDGGWGYSSWATGQEGIDMCTEDWFRSNDGSWLTERGCRWRGLNKQP